MKKAFIYENKNPIIPTPTPFLDLMLQKLHVQNYKNEKESTEWNFTESVDKNIQSNKIFETKPIDEQYDAFEHQISAFFDRSEPARNIFRPTRTETANNIWQPHRNQGGMPM